jgi:hypothetical protein
MIIDTDNRSCPVPATRTMGRCSRPSRYFITYFDAVGEHVGAMVCGSHERSLARRHLLAMAPWMTRNEIVHWDMADWP